MLKGGEEGVELGERGAVSRLELVDGGDAAGELLLVNQRGKKNWELADLTLEQVCLA